MMTVATAEATAKGALPFELDAGIGARASIGLVVLSSDRTIEHEFRTLLDIDGVALHQSRIRNDNRITPETLSAMETRITEATDVILPDMALDVVAFACTSAAMVIGEERVFERIREARPSAVPTTPITAVLAALDRLGAPRIALITPYRGDVDRRVRRYIEARGIEVVTSGSFEEEDDLHVGRITERSIEAAALELGRHPAVDAVVVSCTALRTAGIVEAVETALGKPVTSSNHALAWHCLRLAGVADRLNGRGQLFRLDLPPA